MLNEIQASGLVRQAAVLDSMLYVGVTGGAVGVEIWNVAQPAAPVFRGRVATMMTDFCVRDTYLYVTQALDGVEDTFKVYSVADPQRVNLLGSCRDSGDMVTVTNGAAFLGDRWGLYGLDVSNPANPHRIGSYPGMPVSLDARGTICCVTFGNPNQPDWLEFDVLDVSDPSSPRRVGYLSNTGGHDIFIRDSLVYLSGYATGGHEFKLLSIADSSQPRLVGSCVTPGDGWGVWASTPLQRALVADFPFGLTCFDISDLTTPAYDTTLLVAGISLDIAVDGSLAAVASDEYGMVLLDVGTPASPVQVGVLDSSTTITTHAVAIRDSFAYMGYSPSLGDLHTVDISDPTNPVSAGGVNLFNWPEDIALRDSFVYCTEVNRFQVVNVALPREPVLVGTCSGDGVAVIVQDSFAYTAAGAIRITNVARPDSPFVVSTISGHSATGLAVRDTFLYIPYVYDTLLTYSVATPGQPRLLSAVLTGVWPWDIVLDGSRAYVALSDGYGIDVFDLADPGLPVRRGRASALGDIRRLCYDNGLVYAALWEAGVAVYETTALGISDAQTSRRGPCAFLSVSPSPVRGLVRISGLVCVPSMVRVTDVIGRDVTEETGVAIPLGPRSVLVDVSRLGSGVYFVYCREGRATQVAKFVKR